MILSRSKDVELLFYAVCYSFTSNHFFIFNVSFIMLLTCTTICLQSKGVDGKFMILIAVK